MHGLGANELTCIYAPQPAGYATGTANGIHENVDYLNYFASHL